MHWYRYDPALRRFVSPRLEEQARRHAQQAQEGHEHHGGGEDSRDWRQRLTSAEAWADVAANFRGDWTMLWKEITLGFLLAGFIGLLGDDFFNFLFLTDAHIQPELNATIGTDMAFKKARTIKADFAINGGDHVFDSLAVPKQRALALFDLYGKTDEQVLRGIQLTINGISAGLRNSGKLSSPRRRGPITPGGRVKEGVGLTASTRRHGVWVPAFAGTTLENLDARCHPQQLCAPCVST